MKNLKNDKIIWVISLVTLLIDFIYAKTKPLFWINFTDAVSFSAYVLLFVGVVRWGWMKGDFAYFKFNPYKNQRFQDFRKELEERRKEKKNPCLYAGILLFILSLILSYYYTNLY